MTHLIGLLVLVVAVVLVWRMLGGDGEDTASTPAATPQPMPAPAPASPPTIRTRAPRGDGPGVRAPASVPAAQARPTRTRLFAPGAPGLTPGVAHDGPYAVVGYVTTGFTPVRDRIVDIAVLHLDHTGTVLGQYSTHLDPGAAVLPLHLEPLAQQLYGAPSFARVAPHLMHLLDGRVVVAHHADFLEQFLDAHLMEAGILAHTHPALDTATLARSTFDTPNQRLGTLAHAVGSPAVVGRSALDDAWAVAALVPPLLDRHRRTLRYPVPADGDPTRVVLAGPTGVTQDGPRPDPWLVGIFAAASGLARELNDTRVARFLDVLTAQLLQGRLVVEEVRSLTRTLVTAGYNADDLRGIQERLLESLRRAAFAQKGPIGPRLHHLRATAASVGIPGYFDDLIPATRPPAPKPGSGSFSRPVRKPLPPAPPAHLPRCGHCLEMGHYTSQCPKRERGPVRAIDPIRPV